MTTNLAVGDRFPDATLPDQNGRPVRLASLTRPSQMDAHLGFSDGYPSSSYSGAASSAHATSSSSASSCSSSRSWP